MERQRELFDETDPPIVPERYDRNDTTSYPTFVDDVWRFYRAAKREMPWRDDTTPYSVLVSEVMLQQTQVSRVTEKYRSFIASFPTLKDLAAAQFADVLAAWRGLGYNRRARYLHQAARRIVEEYGGIVPESPDELRTLPGIGVNTAGSIAAFAFNRPVVFIETNIRRVFLTAFFSDRNETVHDREILPLIRATLPKDNPREWYWALMDLGVFMAKRYGNANVRSAHYTRQAPFENSDRQLRGRILRIVGDAPGVTVAEMPRRTGFTVERVEAMLSALEREGMVTRDGDAVYVAP